MTAFGFVFSKYSSWSFIAERVNPARILALSFSSSEMEDESLCKNECNVLNSAMSSGWFGIREVLH